MNERTNMEPKLILNGENKIAKIREMNEEIDSKRYLDSDDYITKN